VSLARVDFANMKNGWFFKKTYGIIE